MLVLSFALKTAGQIYYLVFAVLFLIVGVIALILTKRASALVCFLIISLFCLRILSIMGDMPRYDRLNGIGEDIRAVVTETPTVTHSYSNYGTCTIMIIESGNGILNKGERLLLTSKDAASLYIGDEIAATVKLETLSNHENSVSFYSNNVFMTATPVTMVLKGESKGIYSLSAKVRNYCKDILTENTKNYSVLLAILTGEKSYISDETYDNVKTAGVSHILVVSGMHFAVLCTFMIRLISLIKCPEFIKDILLLAFLFALMCVCGFTMSILRAAAVYIIALIYRRLKRIGDGVLFISNAVIVVLFIHPFAVYSIVFCLSFASTFGIICLSGKFKNFLGSKRYQNAFTDFASETAAVSLSAYVATLPVVIYYFGYISTYSVPVNLLVSLPSTLMLILTFLGIILRFIPFISKIFLFCADFIAGFFLRVVNAVQELPFNVLRLRNTKLLTAVILITFILVYLYKTKYYRLLKFKKEVNRRDSV